MGYYESLHNHTTASDGTQTYAEVLATAEAGGFGVVAFTDHDMLPSEADLAALRAYDGSMKWLLGCEISSGLPRELGGGATSMFHILGLFTDPTNKALLEHCRQALAARTERMERIVTNLTGLGFIISIDDCLRESGGESVGRPHIVKALSAHPENAAIIERIRGEMEAAAMDSASVAMDYMRMMQRDPSDYPYRLFLSDDAFISGVYVDYLYSIDMDASVKLIREAGGVAILAHWPTIWRKINAEMLEGFLRDGRLDGVELRSGFMDSDVERAGRQLATMAGRHKALTTIGIDGHRPEDIQRFGRDTALAAQTVGQTARLIERIKPDLGWSNLA
jgi:predicted metal-dependent phosphoesterase TrpH